jgi:dienelactone hydrolase
MISKQNILKLLLSIISISLILLALALAYFLTQRNKTVTLPKPTGSFSVGRIGYDWIDDTRFDPFSKTKDDKRKLSIWIWYPVTLTQNAKNAKYFPDKWEEIQEKDSGIPLLQQNFKTIKNSSFKDVPLSPKQSTYPLIVFEPGMGNIVFNYTALAENLASQGYIVVGINPTYSSRYVVFSDGSVAYRTTKGSIPESDLTDKQMNDIGSRLLKTWTGDMRFALNKLEKMNTEQGNIWSGHIDLKHIGAFGHSFGGAASAKACLEDTRIKAGIDIDGYLYGVKESPKKPFMFIMSKHSKKNDPYFQEFNKIQEVYKHFKKDGYLIEIPEAAHFSFTDNAVFFSPILKGMGVYGTIKGESGLQITNYYMTAFFNKYLKNKNSPFISQKPSNFNELKIHMK